MKFLKKKSGSNDDKSNDDKSNDIKRNDIITLEERKKELLRAKAEASDSSFEKMVEEITKTNNKKGNQR